MNRPSIVAVGMFDGVHTGHRFILDRLVRLADEEGLCPAVVTFANHPRSVTAPDRQPPMLTDETSRIAFIRSCGVERVLSLPFDEELRRLTAVRFAEKILIPQLQCRAILLGHDNGFGTDRLRDIEDYRAALAPLGIDVYGCSAMPGESVSSTAVRRALSDGDIASVNRMLGREYTVAGTVVHGRHLGSTIGFPTANIDTGMMQLPAPGVYAGRVVEPQTLANLPVMLNIGTAPTVNGLDGRIIVEAHIVSDTPLGELYGQRLEIAVLARMRDERRFASLDELTSALAADRRRLLTDFGLKR